MNGQQAPGGNTATFMALCGILLVVSAFVVLAALVLPQILGIVLVVGGFVLYCIVHYLVWGWWLSGRRLEDGDESDRGR